MAKQEIAKDFLVLWQTEACPALQKHFAEQYRRMVGVDPLHHDEFKEGLERIRVGGGMCVADVVALFNRRDQLKGSASIATDAIAGA